MARWVQVLGAFLRQDEWGVRELARATGLSRSASHRILHEMQRLDLLAARPDGGFVVGPVLARIATHLAARVDIVRVARPILEETMKETGETVVIAQYVRSRRQVWPLDAVETPHPVRFIWDSLPDWRELHIGATGKGILAFLPDDERHAIIEQLPDPVVSATSLSKRQLSEQLATARRNGYVVSRGESFAGGIAVAAPIRDASAVVVGDIVISWPDSRTSRTRERELGSVAMSAADRVARGLGFLGDTWRHGVAAD
jgi:IclR family acetate operon transcriptional repressor